MQKTFLGKYLPKSDNLWENKKRERKRERKRKRKREKEKGIYFSGKVWLNLLSKWNERRVEGDIKREKKEKLQKGEKQFMLWMVV